MAQEHEGPQPGEQVARLYEQAEARAADAGENLVSSKGFASVLGQMAENAAALTKLGTGAMDLVIRNLRVAGRRDVVRLSRQLARNEDKLERVLQELEEVRDELGRERSRSSSAREGARANGASSRGSGESGGSASRRSSSTKRTGAKQRDSSSS